MSEIIIREAIEADAPAMVRYMEALLAEKRADMQLRPVPSIEDEIAFVRKAAAADRAVIVVAMEGERMVGLLDLWAQEPAHHRHWGKFGMSVAMDKRGQGIGARLLEFLIARAKTWDGFCRIELDVLPWNTQAIALYEKLGFE